MAEYQPPERAVTVAPETSCPPCMPHAPISAEENAMLLARLQEVIARYGFDIINFSDVIYAMAHDPNHPDTGLYINKLIQPNG